MNKHEPNEIDEYGDLKGDVESILENVPRELSIEFEPEKGRLLCTLRYRYRSEMKEKEYRCQFDGYDTLRERFRRLEHYDCLEREYPNRVLLLELNGTPIPERY